VISNQPGREGIAKQAAPGEPLVTIVITSYNYGKYVADAISSALAQTYRNIEVLVLDNASTDNSLEVIRSFSDERLRVIARTENVGIQRNHNDAILEARGDYVVFLSADDMLMPTLVEDVLDYRRVHPDIDIVYASVCIVNKDLTIAEYFDHQQFDAADSYMGRNEFANLLTRDSCMYLPTVLFPREIFNELGLLDETLTVILDYEYDIRMASAGKRFGFIAKPEALIRFHGENRSGVTAFVKSGAQLREFCILLERYTQPKYHQQLAGYRSELHAMVERKIAEIGAPYPAELEAMKEELAPYVMRARASIAAVPQIGDDVLAGKGLISAVIPFGGRMGPLIRALSSLKAQTYERWEAVVVCDGTPDPEAVVAHLGLQDRVRVTRMRRNGRGPGAARNAGLGEINGEIITYLDDDDKFAPNYFAELARMFVDPSTEVTIGRANYEVIGRSGSAVAEMTAGGESAISLVANRVPLGAVAHRRYCLAQTGLFRADAPALEDWEFLLRLTKAFPPRRLEAEAYIVCLDEMLDRQYIFGRRTSEQWSQYASVLQGIYNAYPASDESDRQQRAVFQQRLQEIVQKGVNAIGKPTEILQFAAELSGHTLPVRA
jgi:O-antigen biosynthesis protein